MNNAETQTNLSPEAVSSNSASPAMSTDTACSEADTPMAPQNFEVSPAELQQPQAPFQPMYSQPPQGYPAQSQYVYPSMGYATPMPQAHMKSKEKRKRNMRCVPLTDKLGFATGVLSILLAVTLLIFGFKLGSAARAKSGTDMLAAIQQTTAAVANSICDLILVVAFGFGAMLIVVGCVLILHFAKKIAEAAKEKKDK